MKARSFAAAAVFLALALIFGGGGPVSAESGINWMALDTARAQSKKTGKPVLVSFYTTWCGYCKKMDRETFRNPSVIKAVNENFLPVMIDGDEEPALSRTYAVRGYPTIVFTDDAGKSLLASPGYRPPEHFLALLKYVHSGMYKKMTYEKFYGDGFARRYAFPAAK